VTSATNLEFGTTFDEEWHVSQTVEAGTRFQSLARSSNATDRADAGAGTEPPGATADKAELSDAGGAFIEGTNKWLTFAFSGRRRRSAGTLG
jgi:hypothetical protein